MLQHKLPLHVSTMREMSELLVAEQPELDRLQQNILNMMQEFHVLTATTKTLNHWEDFLGLERKPSWEVQRRRERCYSRLVAGGNMTSDALKELIEQVGGVECEIDEDATNLTISVRFTGQYGVPTYIDDIKIEVEKIRPYHPSNTGTTGGAPAPPVPVLEGTPTPPGRLHTPKNWNKKTCRFARKSLRYELTNC